MREMNTGFDRAKGSSRTSRAIVSEANPIPGTAEYQSITWWNERYNGGLVIYPNKEKGFRGWLVNMMAKLVRRLGVGKDFTTLLPVNRIVVSVDDGDLADRFSAGVQRILRYGYKPSEVLILMGQDLMPQFNHVLHAAHHFNADYQWSVMNEDGLTRFHGVDILIVPHMTGYVVVPKKDIAHAINRPTGVQERHYGKG